MRATNSFLEILRHVLAMSVLVVGTAASADIGAGTLVVDGVPYDSNRDCFVLQIGVACIVWIEGVSPTEVGGSPETIPVWVKSSSFGNTMHTATRRDPQALTYWFRYTPPAISVGGEFDACGDAIVSYGSGHEGGYDARSLCFGPGWWCQSNPWAAVLRFVNASGAEIPCPPTGVEDALWTSIKRLYR